MHYNLLDEKWIMAKDNNNNFKPVSIKECLFGEYQDIESPKFHGYRFYIYDYLLIRLMSTIVADILLYAAKKHPERYEESIDYYIAQESKNGKISEEFKSFAEDYFQMYHDRFNLFDAEYPFLQFTDKEIESFGAIKEETMIKLNPLAPAETGRLFPESFGRYVREDQFAYAFCTDGMKKKEISEKVQRFFSVTPEEAVYIVLYLASAAPGVGAGNKSALIGNSYIFEVIKAKSLYETLLWNIPIHGYLIENDELNDSYGLPAWRWNSVKDQESKILKNGTIHTMEGMFFPCKAIHLYYGKATTDISVKISMMPKDFNTIIDDLRILWGTRKEPHALPIRRKDTDNNEIKNPYRKIVPGDSLWLLLASTSQTEQTELLEKRGKNKEILKILQSPGSSLAVQAIAKSKFLPETIHIRYYYRMADSKWVYYKTGMVDGEIPNAILSDPIRQQYVCQMEKFIVKTKQALRKQCQAYFDKEDGKSEYVLKKFMDSIKSTFVGEQTFLNEISSVTEEEFTHIYSKWKFMIAEKALTEFTTLMTPNKMELFWNCYNSLRYFLTQ